MECLVRHPWHGNIRELKNVIERVMILEDKDVIELEDLPEGLRCGREGDVSHHTGPRAIDLGSMTLEEIEREAIRAALEQSSNNQVRAARLLGITRDTLRYRLKKYDMAAGLHASP